MDKKRFLHAACPTAFAISMPVIAKNQMVRVANITLLDDRAVEYVGIVHWGPFVYSGRTTCANTELPDETLVTASFYSIHVSGSINFLLDPRPINLNGGRIPDRKEQRKYESYQTRLQRSPIAIAKEYKRQMRIWIARAFGSLRE